MLVESELHSMHYSQVIPQTLSHLIHVSSLKKQAEKRLIDPITIKKTKSLVLLLSLKHLQKNDTHI